MNFKRQYFNSIIFLTLLFLSSCSGKNSNALDYCDKQIRKTLAEIGQPELLPRCIPDGQLKWELTPADDWTSGFWPGILWYDYEHTQDQKLKEQAIYFTELLRPLADKATSHDLGFQIFCSYGNAYRLTGDKKYKDILLKSAEELSSLYNPKVGTILSWPWKVTEENWPHNTIMDNMMNLELLFWASKNGGGKRFYDIALSHALKTKTHQFREDGSNYHVAIYDTISGNFIKAVTHQGYSDNSMWARGQAWAIYGYTMVYRETRDKQFLRFAEKVTDIYLNRLPEDYIPYWDFDAPDIPNAPKDASAAAIVASALLELSSLEDNTSKAIMYKDAATKMLGTLSSEEYRSGNKNASLLLHSTGHYPQNSEIDAAIIYADYYYIEALTRLKNTEAGSPAIVSNRFIHPGILHTKEELDRIKTYTDKKIYPAYYSYELLLKSPLSSSNYELQGPFEVIARLGPNSYTKRSSEDDHEAAYLNALMWYITKDKAHADKSIEILNAYSKTLKLIGPNDNDDPLCASLQGSMLANAAELIKHTYNDVKESDIKSWETMFRTVFIPILDTFFKAEPYTNGNWGAAATKAYMAFGIFLEDEGLYDFAVDFYYNGNDNGSLKGYLSETGQCQESGRDQNHVMFGLGNLAEACETAYNQGDASMYNALDNRLLTGYEYTAKYNLGNDDVPFSTWKDVTGKYSDWTKISTELRGHKRPVWEIVYNHYVTREGLEMPWTKKMIEYMGPEGDAQWCDGPGYGTLLFRTDQKENK